MKKKFRRNLNTKFIKSKASYYVYELAKLLQVHENTIGNMIKNGLIVIEGSYPYLIYGQDEIDFIRKQQKQRKFGKLAIGEFMCFSCKKKVEPLDKSVVLEIKSPKVGNIKSSCDICNKASLNKNISLQKLPEILNIFKIKKLLNPLLIQGFVNSDICETKKQENHEKI